MIHPYCTRCQSFLLFFFFLLAMMGLVESLFPEQGLNSGSWQSEPLVLSTWPVGNSQVSFFLKLNDIPSYGWTTFCCCIFICPWTLGVLLGTFWLLWCVLLGTLSYTDSCVSPCSELCGVHTLEWNLWVMWELHVYLFEELPDYSPQWQCFFKLAYLSHMWWSHAVTMRRIIWHWLPSFGEGSIFG